MADSPTGGRVLLLHKTARPMDTIMCVLVRTLGKMVTPLVDIFHVWAEEKKSHGDAKADLNASQCNKGIFGTALRE